MDIFMFLICFKSLKLQKDTILTNTDPAKIWSFFIVQEEAKALLRMFRSAGFLVENNHVMHRPLELKVTEVTE